MIAPFLFRKWSGHFLVKNDACCYLFQNLMCLVKTLVPVWKIFYGHILFSNCNPSLFVFLLHALLLPLFSHFSFVIFSSFFVFLLTPSLFPNQYVFKVFINLVRIQLPELFSDLPYLPVREGCRFLRDTSPLHRAESATGSFNYQCACQSARVLNGSDGKALQTTAEAMNIRNRRTCCAVRAANRAGALGDPSISCFLRLRKERPSD